jgi:hypothetical protein
MLTDPSWDHGVAAAVDITLIGRFYERYCATTPSRSARRVVYIVTGADGPARSCPKIPDLAPARRDRLFPDPPRGLGAGWIAAYDPVQHVVAPRVPPAVRLPAHNQGVRVWTERRHGHSMMCRAVDT